MSRVINPANVILSNVLSSVETAPTESPMISLQSMGGGLWYLCIAVYLPNGIEPAVNPEMPVSGITGAFNGTINCRAVQITYRYTSTPRLFTLWTIQINYYEPDNSQGALVVITNTAITEVDPEIPPGSRGTVTIVSTSGK